MTPASPRPPCQWPTIDDAKLIIRRATPPWVRKLPARMKNGIAMISNFSMPVKSFSATDSIGTVVIVNRYVSTVRPSEIEIGIPVSIRPNSSAKMIHALLSGTPASLSAIGMRDQDRRDQRRPARSVATGPAAVYERALMACASGSTRLPDAGCRRRSA